MTYWEKLCIEYPDLAKYGCEDKRIKCPCTWGYEMKIKGACRLQKNCTACWNRKMPERRQEG